MADSILNNERFQNIDLLVPLPLYKHREKKRGYNQSEVLCRGIASVLNIPVNTEAVIRQYATQTQTRKQRTQRWENVDGSFIVVDPEQLNGKHLLLVDDVLTTGATMEAFAQAIIKNCDARISIASLAMAFK